MPLSIVDLIVFLAVGVAAGKGAWKGFINEAVTLAGYVVGMFVAMTLYAPVGTWIAVSLGFDSHLTQVIAFVLLLVGVIFGAAMVGAVLTKAGKALQLSGANRALGGVFGAAKGALLCGVIFAVLTEHPIIPSLTESIQQSLVAPYLVIAANWAFNLIKI